MGVDVLSQGVKVASALVSPLIMLALLVLGVGMMQPAATLSADDTRAAFVSLVDETQTIAGGTWDDRDDSTGRGCIASMATEGTAYAVLRLATSGGTSTVVQRVSDAWTGGGLEVERTRIGDVTQLTGRGDGDEVLIFRANERAMTLLGESSCIPD